MSAPLGRADSATGGPLPSPGDAIVSCSFRGLENSEEVAIAAGESANLTAQFVCAQGDPGNLTISEAATAVAEAVADAAAAAIIPIDCFAQTTSTIIISGMRLEEFLATSLSEQFTRNITAGGVCASCNISAAFVAEALGELLPSAAANASRSVPRSVALVDGEFVPLPEFVDVIRDLFVADFAEVLEVARGGAAEEGCVGPAAEPDAAGDSSDAAAPEPGMGEVSPAPAMDRNATALQPGMSGAAEEPDTADAESAPQPGVMVEVPTPAADANATAPAAGPSPTRTMPPAGNTMQVICDVSQPVAGLGMCAGRGVDTPKACASPGFLCVTKNEFFAACREGGVPPSEAWEGIVFECV